MSYDYIVDFDRHPEWRFDVLESKLVHGETGRAGARYRQKVKQGRRETSSRTWKPTDAQPERSVGFRTVDERPVTASGTCRIMASGSGSELVNGVTIETLGFVRLFELFMGPSCARPRRGTRRRWGSGSGRWLRASA